MQSAEFIVPPESQGTRLDQFLVAQLAESKVSRARIQDLIKSGHVTLNAVETKPNARLKPGDAVSWNEPAPATVIDTLPEEIAIDVLFEDEDLIVVNKPAGLVVHPAAGNWDGTLVNALLYHCKALSGVGGEQRPGIVHRLDKETSGCIVAAKNDLAHQGLSGQFARREVTKIYLALAAGHFPQPRGIINDAIHRHPVDRKKMAVVARGQPGRSARTDWRVLCEIGKDSLVECTLHSGRTHQIRVHLKHLNHPLLGDELYGKRGRFARQMLHAWRLGFSHPRSGERLSFESPIPADFVEAGAPKTLP